MIRKISGYGHTISEYMLIFALVTILAIPAVTYLGSVISDSFNDNGDIQSKGSRLFSLLGGTNGGGGVSVASASQFPGLSSKGQPVDNVYFNYNSETGMVEVLLPDGTPGGNKATSADGTKVLAQNMKTAAEKAGVTLSEAEQEQLNKISDMAFELADMEKTILEKYPKVANGTDESLYLFGSWVRKGDGFVRRSPPRGIPDLYGKYVQFSQEYDKLAAQLPENDPRLAEVREVIDANSSLITQLAYQNFVEPQSDFLDSKSKFYRDFYSYLRNEATSEIVLADGIDITRITAEETPVETRIAGNKIKNAENEGEAILNGEVQ